MKEILEVLEKNARLTSAQIGAMVGMDVAEVEEKIAEAERAGIIHGYRTLIDWDKTGRELCQARIEIKVTPKSGKGFEEIAGQIAEFEEVETVYLMSGSYDIALTISGRSFKDIALFGAPRLAPMDSVESTSTLFVLRKYKERGFILQGETSDEREAVTP